MNRSPRRRETRTAGTVTRRFVGGVPRQWSASHDAGRPTGSQDRDAAASTAESEMHRVWGGWQFEDVKEMRELGGTQCLWT